MPFAESLKEDSIVKCTACRSVLNHNDPTLLLEHPTLGVLICKTCASFYKRGEWKRDEEGQDEFCRWCGEGKDQLYICASDNCLRGFCRRCIKANLGRDEICRVEADDEWRCYICEIEESKLSSGDTGRSSRASFGLQALRHWTKAVLAHARNAPRGNAQRDHPFVKKRTNLSSSFNALFSALRNPKGVSVQATQNHLLHMICDARRKLHALAEEIKSDRFPCLVTIVPSDHDLSKDPTLLMKAAVSHSKRESFGQANPSVDVLGSISSRESPECIVLSDDEKGSYSKGSDLQYKANGLNRIFRGDECKENSVTITVDGALKNLCEAVASPINKTNRKTLGRERKHPLSEDNKAGVLSPFASSEDEHEVRIRSSGNSPVETRLAGNAQCGDDSLPCVDSRRGNHVIEACKSNVSDSSSVGFPENSPKATFKILSPVHEVSIYCDDGVLVQADKTHKESQSVDKSLSSTVVKQSEETSLSAAMKRGKSDDSAGAVSSDSLRENNRETDGEASDDKQSSNRKSRRSAGSSSGKGRKEADTGASEKDVAASGSDSTARQGSSNKGNGDDEDDDRRGRASRNIRLPQPDVAAEDDDEDDVEVVNEGDVSAEARADAQGVATTDPKALEKHSTKKRSVVTKSEKELEEVSIKVNDESHKSKTSDHHQADPDSDSHCSKDDNAILELLGSTDRKIKASRGSAGEKQAFTASAKDVKSENGVNCEGGKNLISANDKDGDSKTGSSSNKTYHSRTSEKRSKSSANCDEEQTKSHKNLNSLFSSSDDDAGSDIHPAELRDEPISKPAVVKDGSDVETFLVQPDSIGSDSDLEVVGEVKSSKKSPAKASDKDKNTRRLRKRSVPSISKEAASDGASSPAQKRRISVDTDSDGGNVPRSSKRSALKRRKRTCIEDSDDEERDSQSLRKTELDLSSFEGGSDSEKSNASDIGSKKNRSKGVPGPKKAKGKARRRAKIVDSDEDSDEDKNQTSRKQKKKASVENDDEANSEGQNKEGRKFVRKIMSDDKIQADTRIAAKEEAERRRRVLERQKMYNEIEEALKKERKDDKVVRCVLEYDKDNKEALVEVDLALAAKMKPHQVEGVKFLYNTIIESLEQIEKIKGDSSVGGGAILAHCMGLGKTFQAICFIHTLFTNPRLNKFIKKVIVVCPCNVVLNWAREFELWIEENEGIESCLNVFEFSRVKNIHDRVDMLDQWTKEGGVLIMGYSMFRVMTTNKIRSKKYKEKIPKLLHDPGADLVVCDEGHMLKSDKAMISKAMAQIKTRRRVILTGTPLQNSMSEYHCMVSFVKPNLLGTQKEFNNRFMNPITYGQEANATSIAVKIMKKRVHILNKLLSGCVHRRDYSHLTPYLPTKFEYILSVDLGDLQMKLYREYLRYIGISEETTREDLKGRSLLKDYQCLKLVWTHPYLLVESAERLEDRLQRKALRDDLDDFVVDASEGDSSGSGTKSSNDESETSDSDKDEVVKKYRTRRTRAGAEDANSPLEDSPVHEPLNKIQRHKKLWWNTHVPQEEDDLMKLELSSKLSLAFYILRQCELIGDKVILFSSSILTLDIFEEFLQAEYDRCSRERVEGDYLNTWVHGIDYFRLDGSTHVDTRKKCIDAFNDPQNLRARLFLVSTKAGGIGTNMIGANRVILLDASWNPSDDTQAIFRAYRYGQNKPVYVYRLLAHATMEEKIYDRQVNKISLACRVVDEQNLERHFNEGDLKALYEFKPEKDARKTPAVPKDRLLAEMLIAHKDIIQGYHEHDSLLQRELEDELTEEERKAAWKEYEDERDGKTVYASFLPNMANAAPGGSMPSMAGMFPGAQHYPGMPGVMHPGMVPPGATAGTANNAAYYNFIRQQQQQQQQAAYAHMAQQQQQHQQSQAQYRGALPKNWEEILARPPHFKFTINHPSLNPMQILNEIKLRNPTADQLTIGCLYRDALLQKKHIYLLNLHRTTASADVYKRMLQPVPSILLSQFQENESAVRILESLVFKLNETIQAARNAFAARKEQQESMNSAPVIELDETNEDNSDVRVVGSSRIAQSSTAANMSTEGRTASRPIIEEIE